MRQYIFPKRPGYVPLDEQEIEMQTMTNLNQGPPPAPPMPSGFHQPVSNAFIPYSPPELQNGHVYVTDQHSLEPSWRRIGDPIPKNMLQQRGIGGLNTWSNQHHNINLPHISRYNDQQINDQITALSPDADLSGNRQARMNMLGRLQANPDQGVQIGNQSSPNRNPLAPPSQAQQLQERRATLANHYANNQTPSGDPSPSPNKPGWGQRLSNAMGGIKSKFVGGPSPSPATPGMPKESLSMKAGNFMNASSAVLGSLMLMNQMKHQRDAEENMQQAQATAAANRI